MNVFNGLSSEEFAASIQVGLRHAIGATNRDPMMDVLVEDIKEIEEIYIPASGTNITSPHHYPDFYFVHYASKAFRYFRNLYGIKPDDYLVSLCNEPLRLISNPGASGSMFFISSNDCFILKTVQKKEAEFLRVLLNQYFFNLSQNPISMIPKIFGLYTYKSSLAKRSVRFVIMNNLLPTYLSIDLRFDLKGSTYQRYASEKERQKKSPTFKDLDFFVMDIDEIICTKKNQDPQAIIESEQAKKKLLKATQDEGSKYLSLQRTQNPSFYIKMPSELFEQYRRTLVRDVRVLSSCKIMDYSMLVGVHFLTEKSIAAIKKHNKLPINTKFKHFTFNDVLKSELFSLSHTGGYLAYTNDGRPILVFLGIIDILQQYKLFKKTEHAIKSLYVKDGSAAISVCPPKAYGNRFLELLNGNAIRCATDAEIAEFDKLRLHKNQLDQSDTASRLTAATSSQPDETYLSASKIESSRTSAPLLSNMHVGKDFQQSPKFLGKSRSGPIGFSDKSILSELMGSSSLATSDDDITVSRSNSDHKRGSKAKTNKDLVDLFQHLQVADKKK